jgi:hypothetical protein
MGRYVRPILGIAVMLNLACSKQATKGERILTIEDLLVRDNEITGWSHSGPGWEARSIAELTAYINGLAEIYQRHGFAEGAHQVYAGTIDGGRRALELSVYEVDSEENARGLFEDPDLGLSGATPWTEGAGEEAQYVRFGGLSQALAFYRGTYFVFLGLNYDTEESLNILKQFALNVDGKLQ